MAKVHRESHLLSATFSFCVPAWFTRSVCISFIVLISFAAAFAQNDPPMPDDVAPPPLKIISKDEKEMLAAEAGVKDRTTMYITLLESRLRKAEEFSTKEDFNDSLTQFGAYQGLLENMMEFLVSENKSNKALSGFKRLEMILRAHNVRIETVRRTMPFKYAYHISKLQKFIRKSRAQATDSLFSDSVVLDKKP
jgi:hypothetical protein